MALSNFANSASILARISSRTRRNSDICPVSDPVAWIGSSNGQCQRSTAAGKTGQFSSAEEQTPITTSGGQCFDSVATERPQESLRHLAAAGIAGAKEKNASSVSHRSGS